MNLGLMEEKDLTWKRREFEWIKAQKKIANAAIERNLSLLMPLGSLLLDKILLFDGRSISRADLCVKKY